MKKVGLVFSGGGGKGAYEIGVWNALNAYGITQSISAVSGTSVGALNAALYAQGNLMLANSMWEKISPKSVMTLNYDSYLQKLADFITRYSLPLHLLRIIGPLDEWFKSRLADQGIFSKTGLSHLIDDALTFPSIQNFQGPIYVAAYNLTKLQLEYFDLKKAKSITDIKAKLLASASLPIAFGKTCVNGDLYWDGGIPILGDNTPVMPLYKDGYEIIIVVHLCREESINRDLYPGCIFLEIMPQDDLGGMIRGTLNFTRKSALYNMQLGYRDACNAVEMFLKNHKVENE